MTLQAEDFRFIADLMRERSAIVLEKGKEYLVDSRLTPVALQAGKGNIAGLVRELRANPASPLMQRVIDAMTTNETSFFRDGQPFEHLRRSVLPAVMQRRAAERELSIWCAASSSGQEPYSVAMILHEHFPALANWKVKLVASDLSQQMLTRARAGIFSQLEVNRGLPATLLVKHFAKRGIDWEISPALRQAVTWREFNLSTPHWSDVGQFDVVLLRNVMIYFELDTKRRILANVRKVLRADGVLLLGTAETTINVDDRFSVDPACPSCYRARAA